MDYIDILQEILLYYETHTGFTIVNFEHYDERCQNDTGKVMDILIPVAKVS